jgi:TetR/AcrR family transcriptional regulator, transcriptional repressor for nem operon
MYRLHIVVNQGDIVGRKKKYDRNDLIKRALEVFHKYGYAGTSTQLLVDHLNINKFSLYAEFNSKRELFEAVLDFYNNLNVDRNFSPLESPTSSIEDIRKILIFFSSSRNSAAAGRGCLICNTAVEFGTEDPSGSTFSQKYFTRISNAYYQALKNDHKKGVLKKDILLQNEADFLTAATLGIFVMLRANTANNIIKNAANMLDLHLTTLCIK